MKMGVQKLKRGSKAKAKQTSQLHPPGQLIFPRKEEELP